MGQISRMKLSKRKTSKVWLALNTVASFSALFFALFKGMDGAAIALAGLPPFFYGVYTGVGHMDMRRVLSSVTPTQGPE
ncbi:hypothetical protein IB265_34775 [Ensifer sp. ENS10]|uniref:hypothetical protein n=1 Tax=Ensifer sp. ENS10 TaxID=2769286 RepID=UPI00177BD3C0|nr:hypothetical protein [Ensifer sp. ENS10]MBD9511916.1 hypothetical protein [Ensifer sp. ENS10]